MKIIESIWFTEMGSMKPIGIVSVKDENTNEVKHYIGTGQGVDRAYDEKKIMEKGAKFRPEIVSQILKEAEKRATMRGGTVLA